MPEIIITEKPNAAKKVAYALADSTPQKESKNTVPIYRLKHEGRDIVVACAVGHLFTVGEKQKTPWSEFPIFDVEWVPTSDVDKSAAFSKKYATVLKRLAKEAESITVACDFDIEGEVIGLNIIRSIFGAKDAARMKFSTLTKPDLIKAYEGKMQSLSWGQANAGETRHILDFYYGINLTRALTHAINSVRGGFKVLSSGRVQGPALKIIVEREKEIKAFVPEPYWQIELNGMVKESEITAMHETEKFWKSEEAEAVMKNVEGAKQGTISDTQKKQFSQRPPFPFDLTSMQVEAYRVFKIRPKHTLDIAQNLYTAGYISYPRTSSQKLPQQIGYKNILTELSKNQNYGHLAKRLMQGPLKPNEGKKTDDAHPAIYPTGVMPEGLDDRDAKIYDLVVKRFLAVFAPYAKRETNHLNIDVNGETFVTKGTVTIEKGWHEFYAPYVKLDEVELPAVVKGDIVSIKDITNQEKETKPPNRYTQSSIINALEKKGLGTKATRAQIVETLVQRGYAKGESNLEATELGIRTADTLMKYCPAILDENLTRQFEDEMEQIRQKEKTPDQILEKARNVLATIIETFKTREKDIGSELSEANDEYIKKETTLGMCPVCKEGQLVIKKGKFGRFAACNRYPDCKTTYALPKSGRVSPSKNVCESCSMPMVRVKQPNRSPQEICINPECPSKKENGSQETSFEEEGMTCPVCGKGTMVLRTSFYGKFLGCNNYPKCKTMMRIVDGKVDVDNPITQNNNSKKKSAKKKATTKKGTSSTKKKASTTTKKKKKTTKKKSSS